ncbi:MGMT family protein [Ruania albidiflava]|uniref:MGMT family protein n=1 Tax=Ruania albidiflava TaxID=366586 RepID=UPI0003B63019|nr:MGMT family protein [Ruania albidiflava]
MRELDEDYVEAVLDLVSRIPPGRASTYGVIAETIRVATGRGGPRVVGMVMSRYGGDTPWWRLVNARGEMAGHKAGEALARWREEGIALTASDPPRVDLYRAGWEPGEDLEDPPCR